MRKSVFIQGCLLLALNACGQETVYSFREDFESPETIVRQKWHYPEAPAVSLTGEKYLTGGKSLKILYDISREDRHKKTAPFIACRVNDAGLEGKIDFGINLLFEPVSDSRIMVELTGGRADRRLVSILHCMDKFSSLPGLVWYPVKVDKWYGWKVKIHKQEMLCDMEVSDGSWTNQFKRIKLPGAPEDIFPVKYIRIFFGGPAMKGICVYVDDVEFKSSK